MNIAQRTHNKVLLLIEFYNKNKRFPTYEETFKNIKIGTFSYRIKKGKIKISDDDRTLLKELNFFTKIKTRTQSDVHTKVLLLKEYYDTYLKWPQVKDEYKGEKIGAFYCNIQRRRINISYKDKQLLESIGFSFINKLTQNKIHAKVVLLTEFFYTFNRFPLINEKFKEFEIGIFANKIRKGEICISDTDREILNKINFFKGV